MATVRICFVLLLAVFALQAEGQKGRRRKDKGGKNDVNELAERLDDLEEHLSGMDGGCGSKVHFFFHGDDDHHDHPDGQHDHDEDGDEHDHHHDNGDQHVHVHISNRGGFGNFGQGFMHAGSSQAPHGHTAVCDFHNDESGVMGHAHWIQHDGDRYASVRFHFDKLGEAEVAYAVHVHNYGDVSHDCGAIGKHYDPYIEDRDVGDLGSLTADSDGGLPDTWVNDTALSIFSRVGIVGRSMAVHDPTDNSIMACCVIGLGADEGDEEAAKLHGHAHSNGHGHAHRH